MTSRFVMEDDDVVWIDHDGVERETDKAKLVDIHNEKTWVPKSVIVDENDEHIGVKGWWARQRGIEGDWQMSGRDITCPDCVGKGKAFVHLHTRDERHGFQWVECMRCKGKRVVDADALKRIADGKKLRDERVARGMSLGEQAMALGISVVELSKRERGY